MTNHYKHASPRDYLEAILEELAVVQREMQKIMADLTAITSQVAANTSVIQSAITLINGLAAQIQAAGTDPVKLAALVTQLQTDDQALAAAVAANTPAAPPAPTGGSGS